MIHEKPVLLLQSGSFLDYEALFERDDASMLVVRDEDVRRGLEHQVRYAGHIPVVVARHTAIAATLAVERGYGDLVAGYVSVHDRHESYLPDIPRTLKKFLPAYQRAEAVLEGHVHAAYGLPFPLDPETKRLVDEVDRHAVSYEAEIFGHPHADHYVRHVGFGTKPRETAALHDLVAPDPCAPVVDFDDHRPSVLWGWLNELVVRAGGRIPS